MKNIIRKSIGAILLTGTLLTANAQPAEATQTIITSEGTVSEFGPQTIFLRSEPAATPVAYTYSKTTTYVDEAGNPVAVTTVKSGLPVTVYYNKVGDTLLATKVVVRKAVVVPSPIIEQKSTTTTTTTTNK